MKNKVQCQDRVVGAVLAGGRGRRLNADKPSVRFEGITLLERAARLLGMLCDKVLVVGTRRFPAIRDVLFVEDIFKGMGPLAGIHSALSASKGRRCLIIPCDLPFLSEKTLGLLKAETSNADIVIFRHGDSGFLEPLVGIYRGRVLEAAESLLKDGPHSVRDLFDMVKVRFLEVPDSREFFNLNSPLDLANVALERGEKCASGNR